MAQPFNSLNPTVEVLVLTHKNVAEVAEKTHWTERELWQLLFDANVQHDGHALVFHHAVPNFGKHNHTQDGECTQHCRMYCIQGD